MYCNDKPLLDEALLVHYGKKGMKWGVRNNDDTSGGRSGDQAPPNRAERRAQKKEELRAYYSGTPKPLNDNDKAVLKAAGVSLKDSDNLKAKFGPDSAKPKEHKDARLTPEQKELVKKVAIGLGAAAAIYALHRYGKNQLGNLDPGLGAGKYKNLPEFSKEWKLYQNTLTGREKQYSKEYVESLSTTPIALKAGTIFKRISTAKEIDIRPGGFYAAHDAADVDRYKAILPVFWKHWGLPSDSGYVVNLKAKTDIKAPSPKDTFDMFKSMLNDDIPIPYTNRKAKFRDMFMEFGTHADDDSFARAVFPQFAMNWNDDTNKATSHFVKKLKEQGYNALVDMNDSGALARQPMRLLDGSLFEIAGHDNLSADAIRMAQQTIQSIRHALSMLFNRKSLFSGESVSVFEDSADLGENFLVHVGVKGMKWGVRKNNYAGASNRTNREARKDATEFARAKMFYGEGAGTRRKLIKAQIEAKSKKDPTYQKAYEHHLQRQDLGRHAEKARGERRRKDTRAGVVKTGNAINRAINGPFAGSAAIALVAAGAAYAKNTGMDVKAANAVKQAVNNRNLRREVNDLLRNAANFGGRA